MTTKTYRMRFLLGLAVEADDREEAMQKLRELYEEIADSLPTGAVSSLEGVDWKTAPVLYREPQ